MGQNSVKAPDKESQVRLQHQTEMQKMRNKFRKESDNTRETYESNLREREALNKNNSAVRQSSHDEERKEIVDSFQSRISENDKEIREKFANYQKREQTNREKMTKDFSRERENMVKSFEFERDNLAKTFRSIIASKDRMMQDIVKYHDKKVAKMHKSHGKEVEDQREYFENKIDELSYSQAQQLKQIQRKNQLG